MGAHLEQLRLILAPSVFYGAIILAAVMDDSLLPFLQIHETAEIAFITAVAAGSILPLGFIFGAITLGMLVIGGRWSRHCRRYDLFLTDEEIEKLRDGYKNSARPEPNDDFSVAQEFAWTTDQWAFDQATRHWNGLHANAGAAVALVIAGFTVCAIGLSPPMTFWSIFWFLLVALCLVASRSWYECRRIYSFKARCERLAKP